jgi:putative DNA primase/helicase
LKAIFAPGDYVLVRPIETWTESGKKISCVDFKGITYLHLDVNNGGQHGETAFRILLPPVIQRAATERTNVFFGVCPRCGPGGSSKNFDQAWQIRTVRVLWLDIDHVTVEEVRDRIKAAGLPEPSIIVHSGNGCHVYWLLSEPYLIDDAGDPDPVHAEFIDQGDDKKKKVRKYRLEGKEKLYLDIKSNVPELSVKAQLIQDVIAGIASKVGGDHTQDLSRILRIPGTMNRKDEKNGKTPVPCTLVECDPNRRYPFDVFAPLATASPQKAHREKLAKVKLPSHRKLSPSKKDKFAELRLACDTAAVGDRSEADFALCCFAITSGMSKDDVWAEVQNVGKFAEGGQRYFDRTWTAAETEVRSQILTRVEKSAKRKMRLPEAGETPAGDVDEQPDGEQGMVKTLADIICKNEHFAQDAGGKLYRYVSGAYRPKGERFVSAQVKALCIDLRKADEWSTRLASEVVEFIRVDAPELWERPRLDILNVKNGLLRVADRALLSHSPDHLSSVQLPVEYNPKATCPAITKFVSEVFPPDATLLAWELAGWLMLPSTSIQKAVLLLGEGANGKSTWLTLLISFLGKGNSSAVSLHKLESDKFAAARLIGKLANICPDLPSEHLAGTSVFKAITGGDPVPAEYKFKDSFDFTPYARLVFSANHPPRSADASHAFFRRWVVIPFDRTFSPKQQVPRAILDARLSAPAELSGLLNLSLDALARLERQRGFSEPNSIRRAWGEFHAATDPLAVWIERWTVDDPQTLVAKSVLIAAYNADCQRNGRPPLTNKAFGLALRRVRPNIEEGQRVMGGGRPWCYIGIGMSGAPSQASQSTESCPVESRNSRDARDSLYPVLLSHVRVNRGVSNEGDIQEKDRADRVHRVHSVNGEGPPTDIPEAARQSTPAG